MKGLVLLGLLCLSFALGVASPDAQADVRAPRDSFLRNPAETVDALVKEIKADPVVQKRFVQHFGKNADELIAYFKSNLVVRPLPSAQKMIVYGCNAKGVIYPRRVTIRKGYPMFCLADGTPVLKARCGNPVGTELPAVVAAKPPERPVKEEQPKEPEAVVEPEPEEQMVELPAVMPDVSSPVLTPEVENVEVAYPVAPGEMTDQTLIIPPIPSGGPTPFLFLLPLIALGGGGGGGNVIPEPSSLAQFGIMGIGLAGVAWARIRRRPR